MLKYSVLAINFENLVRKFTTLFCLCVLFNSNTIISVVYLDINFRMNQRYYISHTTSKYCYDMCAFILKNHMQVMII